MPITILPKAKVRILRFCFFFLREHTFGADNLMYHSFKMLNIELYTDEKSPETEERVEDILRQHHIFYNKSEVWIESEKFYEVLYETEV